MCKSDNILQTLSYLDQVDNMFSHMATYGILVNEGEYDQAQEVLNAMDTSIPEMNDFKMIQTINLERLRNIGDYDLSSSDQVYLESIAESNMGVKAYARTLLSLLKGIEYLDEYSIDEPIQPRSVKSENDNKTSGFNVLPNPVESSATIEVPRDYKDIDLELNVYDIKGEKIFHSTIIGKSSKIINTSSWQSGVYLFHISNEKENVSFLSKVIK